MSSLRETSVDIRKLALQLSKMACLTATSRKLLDEITCVQKIICIYKRGISRKRKEILSIAKRKNAQKLDPKVSAVKLAVRIFAIIGRNICAETVCNVIKKARFNGRIARKKP